MKKVIVIAIISLALGFSSCAKDWYETAAFYQIYPQTFFDDDGKGTGTLSGINKKLDYLKELGIDCLWLTPIFKSSFNAFGYDITDYKAIDTRYGNNETFKTLIDAVHQKGMKIIVDFVPNHCGAAHEFFQKSILKEDDYDDWFVWTDHINDEDLEKPTNWQKMFDVPGSAWTKVDGRENEFYYAKYSPNMPDFNLRNVKVLAYLQSVMEYWLDFGVDGFRVDAISHGVEKDKDSVGAYPNEPRNEEVTDPKDLEYLDHIYTQDQPELFNIIYDWRKFLNEYQEKNKGSTR
jgi:alpha-glucosidase